jgi:hypothetical protein
VFFGRRQRAALRQAGFVNIQVSASYDSYGTPEATRGTGEYLAEQILRPYAADVISEQQWATREQLAEMAAAFIACGEHPDAFWARARCKAVAWKG